MTEFHRGDRVKLTEAGAKIQGHGYRRFAGHYDDTARIEGWRARRGTVFNTPLPAGACVSIKWDGRKAPSAYPKGMVEHLEREDA